MARSPIKLGQTIRCVTNHDPDRVLVFSKIKLEMLSSLIDDRITDKNTTHSYLATYEKLFQPKKETAKNVLEIGICHGGSIKLWSDYFSNATVYGIDIKVDQEWLRGYPRTKLSELDAYREEVVQDFVSKGIKFDVLIDDGPHTKESVVFFAKHYSQILADDGIMIVEDVQDMGWIADFEKIPHLDVEVIDLRKTKGRYDDVLFVIRHGCVGYLKKYTPSAWSGHLEFARWLTARFNPKLSVDLGVDNGHSTFALAGKSKGVVYGIDNFIGAHKVDAQEFVRSHYSRLVAGGYLRDNVTIIKGEFDDVFSSFDELIDILNFDGFHAYESIRNDFTKWITKVNPDGIVLLHDVVAFETTVGKFFDEIDLPKTKMLHSAGIGIVCRNPSVIEIINREWVSRVDGHSHKDYPGVFITL